MSFLGMAGCTRDAVIGEWINDPTVSPRGLRATLSLQERGIALYLTSAEEPMILEGQWQALSEVDGLPRYAIALGCKDPGTVDSTGHCSSTPWVKAVCFLDDDRLSCPDGAIDEAKRFLHTPWED